MSYGETVVRLRAPLVTGARNEQVRDWSNATRVQIRECAIAPQSSELVTGDGREGTSTDVTVFLPTSADVESTDRLEIRGETFTVVGQPADWRQPFTAHRFGLAVGANRVVG